MFQRYFPFIAATHFFFARTDWTENMQLTEVLRSYANQNELSRKQGLEMALDEQFTSKISSKCPLITESPDSSALVSRSGRI